MRVPNPGRDAARGPRHAGTTGGHRSAGCPQPLRRSCWPVLPVWREPRWRTKTTSWPRSALSSRRFRCRPLSPLHPSAPAPLPHPRPAAERSAHPGCGRDARQQRIPDFDAVAPPLPTGSSFRYRPLPTQTLNEPRCPRGGGTAGGGRGWGGHGGAGLIPALTSASPGGSPLGGGPPRPPPPPLRSLPVPPCLKAAP